MAKNCYNKGVKKRRGCHCGEATQKYLEHPANSNIGTPMKKMQYFTNAWLCHDIHIK